MTAKRDSTTVMWRVQRLASTGNWIDCGLFETRATARRDAKEKRWRGMEVHVVRYEKKGRK